MKYGVALSLVGLFIVACSSTPATNDGGADAAADINTPDKKPIESGTTTDAQACASGTTCEVCDGAFTATQMTAPYVNAAVCPSADITAYIAACGSAGNDTNCTNWQNAESQSTPNCYACIYSDQTAPKWGMLVCDQNGSCSFNLGGCLDVATSSVSQEKQAGGQGSCGDLYNAAVDCEGYACNSCTADSDYQACLTSADAHECKSYSDAAGATTGVCANANANDASAAVSACFGSTDADTQAVVTMFCGSGP